MKQTFLTFLLLIICNSTFGQIPSWIKNAQPVTEKHLAKIEKKGKKYIEKFKDAQENSPEKDIYYRVKYIEYLKRLETFEKELANNSESEKPIPFPLVVISEFRTQLKSGDEIIKIESDTLLNIVDIFKNSYSEEKTPIDEFRSYSNYRIIIENNDKSKMYELENSYDSSELNTYPKFAEWIEKYLIYSKKEISRLKLEKEEKEKIAKAENDKKLKELKEKAKLTTCNTKIDDFTGEKSVFTNQQRLVTLENETVKSQAQELWEQGIYADYEMFVFAITTIKKGKNTMIDVYLKHKTDRPLDFYGLIKQGETIDFKLKNGKVINLKFLKSSIPDINYKYKYSIYENILDLTEKDVIELKKSPVQKVRINYTKGYKDYDVTENDLIIKQLKCTSE